MGHVLLVLGRLKYVSCESEPSCCPKWAFSHVSYVVFVTINIVTQ